MKVKNYCEYELYDAELHREIHKIWSEMTLKEKEDYKNNYRELIKRSCLSKL